MEETAAMTKTFDDQMVEKKIKKRKIVNFIILGVTLLFALVIILSSAFQMIDVRPHFIKRADEVEIYSTNLSYKNEYFDSTMTDKINDFQNRFNEVFNISLLNALFTDNFGAYKIGETSDRFYKNNLSPIKEQLGNNYVHLYYEEAQNFYDKNGTLVDKSRFDNTSTITYNEIYFAIDGDNIVKDVTFYFITTGSLSGTDSEGLPKKSITTVTVKGNTYPIYQLVEDK